MITQIDGPNRMKETNQAENLKLYFRIKQIIHIFVDTYTYKMKHYIHLYH